MRRTILLLSVVLGAGVAACRDTKQLPVVSMPSVADSADQVFFTATFLLTTKGVQRGDLTADTAYVLDDQTRIDLRRAHVVFTTETGAPQGTMESDRGTYSTRTQMLDGRGNVIVHLVSGKTLHSPHVTYNQLTHQLASDTSWTSTDGNGASTGGIGFTSNQTFTVIDCLRACGGSSAVRIPEK